MIDLDKARDLALRLSQSKNDEDALTAFEETSRQCFRHILFTALRFDHRAGVMTRLFSNREDVSAVGGSKPIPTEGIWADRLVSKQRWYIGYTKADLKEVFFDHEALWAIGCESVMNVPVVWRRSTIGSFNILGRERQYDEQQASLMSVFAQFAVPLFLGNAAANSM